MECECQMNCGFHCRACVFATSVQKPTSVHVSEWTWEQTCKVAAFG